MLQGGEYKEGDDYIQEDAIQLFQEHGWTTVGHMNVPRYTHAVSVINFDDIICSSSSSFIFGYNEILILCIMWTMVFTQFSQGWKP